MATSHKYHCTSKRMTFGAELELVDWPRNEPLPKGMAIDEGNYTSVNSNGVAVDGKGKTYHLGGEILTAPTESPEGPAEQLTLIQRRWPEAALNYRMGLNVHVRVPGLQDDLKKLKRLQSFVHGVMPQLLPIIDPIPILKGGKSALVGERRCYNIRRRDHHTLLPPWRLELQMEARTPQEFFEAEAIHPPTGKVHWAIAPRTCVNLRQMMQTDTIEFRHFPMPVSAEELLSTTLWCKLFLEVAFDGESNNPVQELLDVGFKDRAWPKFLPYDPWLDEGFHYTSPHHHDTNIVKTHIKDWLTQHNGVRKQGICLKP